MTKANITIVIIVLLVVIGGAFYLERGENPSYTSDTPQATTTQSTSSDTSTGTTTETPGEIVGEVTNFDASQVTTDGPYVLTVSTDSGEVTVEVPSMGLPTCAASSSIANMSDISVGQTVSVSGDVQNNDAIVPCSSEDHYLRIEGQANDGGSQSADGVSIIGTSAGGHDIPAHTFGSGDTRLLFVGGIHGGYEWNTAKLAGRMITWLDNNPSVLPDNISVTVIPVLNPDGLEEIVGTTSTGFDMANVPPQEQTIPGRFNANDVDLNRNFDCNWQPEGTWQSRTVDAGSSAFSEPESQALRDWVQSKNPDAAVVFYSQAGAVYSAACGGSASTASDNLMNTYAQASGYPAAGLFDAYKLNGDAVDWMAKEGITGISVLLETHTSPEWERNKQGIQAVFDSFAN